MSTASGRAQSLLKARRTSDDLEVDRLGPLWRRLDGHDCRMMVVGKQAAKGCQLASWRSSAFPMRVVGVKSRQGAVQVQASMRGASGERIDPHCGLRSQLERFLFTTHRRSRLDPQKKGDLKEGIMEHSVIRPKEVGRHRHSRAHVRWKERTACLPARDARRQAGG